MHEAFKSVKRNRGAAGIDKVSVDMFEANLEENLLALMEDLKKGTLEPKPLRRVFIPKAPGKVRPLGIPAVRDRVGQEVLRRLLSPVFESRFHPDSYGFRPERNCHKAIERVMELWHQGYNYVLDADIKGFFDNLPHLVIMQALAAVVADGNILRLVEKFLKAGIMENGVFKPTTVGTPQGGVISPLLANIALDSLDWFLEEQGLRFVRYADDFVVLCQTKSQAQEALTLIEQHLTDRLGLTLSPEKTHVTSFKEGFAFLGFDISSRSVKMRAKSAEKFKDKVRELTRRSRNMDKDALEKLNRVIRGTANYFATPFSHNRWLFERLDKWIRNRLRCMKFKRIRCTDNFRLRKKHLKRAGLLNLRDFYPVPAQDQGQGLPASEVLSAEPPRARNMHPGK
jgi:group II intron reverse transcriptase/maturase